jgi:integrase
MKRTINRLTTRQAETIKKLGRHADGGNLYLKITADGSRRWVFMYALGGRQREMGLGSASKGGVPLATARVRAAEARTALAAGIDPIAAKKEAEQRAAIARAPTFGKMADDYITAMKPSWRDAKHAAQWKTTLTTHAAPLRSKPVNQIQTADVLETLQPLWQSIPETASRLRGRIENVLDAAKAKGFREGENPARWRGHLSLLLPKREKLTRGHFAALSYEKMSDFMAQLRERRAFAAVTLEFTILTACRSGEVRSAMWAEFDFEKRLWTIPKARTKAGKEHRVPLSDRCIVILKQLAEAKRGPFVFPANGPRGPISNTAMVMLLRRMKVGKLTVHGFRSAFRDWASEATSFPHEVCEAALAHTIKNRAESAYRRGDLLAKRAKLMNAWAEYCEPTSKGKVIPLTRGAKR